MEKRKIDEIALRVADEIPMEERFSVQTICAYACKAMLAELSKDADYACEALGEPGSAARWWWSDHGLSLPKGTKLYDHPANTAEIEQFDAWNQNPYTKVLMACMDKEYIPRADIKEIEQRVAEAFVMEFKRYVGGDGEFWLHELECFCEDGKWREYL